MVKMFVQLTIPEDMATCASVLARVRALMERSLTDRYLLVPGSLAAAIDRCSDPHIGERLPAGMPVPHVHYRLSAEADAEKPRLCSPCVTRLFKRVVEGDEEARQFLDGYPHSFYNIMDAERPCPICPTLVDEVA